MAGIKGVKTGKMDTLRSLTEQQLFKMSKKELVDLLTSTSKTVTANVRRLKGSKYENLSPFLSQRQQNKYPLPREIKRKTAERMGVEQLKQELRDLAYTARLKTSTISGARKYVKEFEKKTGKHITTLTSSDWENIRKKIEEGYDSTGVITAYDVETQEFENLDEIEKSSEAFKQEAEKDISNADMFNII